MWPKFLQNLSKRSFFGIFLIWGMLMLLVYLHSNSISVFILPKIVKMMGISNRTQIAVKYKTDSPTLPFNNNISNGKGIDDPKQTSVKPASKATETVEVITKPVTLAPKEKTKHITTAKEEPKPLPTTPKNQPKPVKTTVKPQSEPPVKTTVKPQTEPPVKTTVKPQTEPPVKTTVKPQTEPPVKTTAKPQPKPTTASPPKPKQPKQACVHPAMDVNEPTMLRLVRKMKRTVCPGKDWVYVDNGTLHFTPEAVKAHKSIACDYITIVRTGEKSFTLAPPITNISNPFQIKDDAFKIECTGGDGQKYYNFHQGVAYRQEYVDRKQDPMKDGFEGMSIAILGFDSMSRMSWLRRLPVTRKYFVETLGAIELEQHNVLGDGTTAVMFPMLTGKFEWELPECRVSFKGAKPMDDFPWIWHEFKKAGYLTSWSNAKPKSAPFNWRMLGFKDYPTDFYPRPYYLAAWPRFKGLCMGSQSRPDIWLHWFRDVFHMYKKQRKFLFHFITDFSHDNNNVLTEMDEPVQKLVEHLHDDGYLNNTLLILMGDHGARYGSFRQTIPGKLEERLPYFSFLFPKWFQKKYPKAIENLRANARRLTTPFDLHATFKEFFKFTGTGKGSVTDRGISLFKEVPLERTCKHADIASHWCACLDWKHVSMGDTGAQSALKAALDTINGYTSEYRDLCALLSVANVSLSTKLEMGKNLLKFKKTDGNGGIYKIDLSSKVKSDRLLYQIVFFTQPGGGEFEVTVTHDFKSGRYLVSRKEISRINKYGDAPHCIVDKNRQIQPYCYCKDLL